MCSWHYWPAPTVFVCRYLPLPALPATRPALEAGWPVAHRMLHGWPCAQPSSSRGSQCSSVASPWRRSRQSACNGTSMNACTASSGWVPASCSECRQSPAVPFRHLPAVRCVRPGWLPSITAGVAGIVQVGRKHLQAVTYLGMVAQAEAGAVDAMQHRNLHRLPVLPDAARGWCRSAWVGVARAAACAPFSSGHRRELQAANHLGRERTA